MDRDEELLRGRVYDADDDPDPGPRPGRTYAELVGDLLDGLLLDVTDGGRDPDRCRTDDQARPARRQRPRPVQRTPWRAEPLGLVRHTL